MLTDVDGYENYDYDYNNDDRKEEWTTKVVRERGYGGLGKDNVYPGGIQGLRGGTPGEFFTGGPPLTGAN